MEIKYIQWHENADKLNMRCGAKEYLQMGKVDQLVSGLQKLYSKRGALDKQISSEEKKLAVEAKASAKAAPAKKAAGKKPAKKAAKKAAAPKPPAK
jgi:peptidoglycan hydrolase CwlO-like protein